MTESETFWISVIDELDAQDVPAGLDPSGLAGDTPLWVTKMGAEVMNMIMPRLQLRMGDRATPEKIGALLGNHLALSDAMAEAMSNSKLSAVLNCARSLLSGFDGAVAMKEMARQKPARRDLLGKVFSSVLERPAEERHRFFRAFTRGIQPERQAKDQRTATERDKEKLKTLVVYGVVLLNWRTFDALGTSREAYEILVKMLSVEIVGHDAERVRRMFERQGKRFRRPGRPGKQRKS